MRRAARKPWFSSLIGHRFFYSLVLCLLVGLLSANTLKNGFTLDDRTVILEDPRTSDLSHIKEIFTQGYRLGPTNSLYRPFTLLSFAANSALTGIEPRGFHLVNILLHLLATLLVFRLSLAIFGGPTLGFVAALFFALHPVHVEAVASVVGRAEMLVAICILACLLIFMRQRGAALSGTGRSYLGVLALYALALLSKESAVVLIALWALFAFYYSSEKEPLRRVLSVVSDYRLWGLVIVTAVYLGVRHAVLGSVAVVVQPEITYVENPLAFAPASVRILTAVHVLVRYLWLMVWPYRLSPDYSYNTVSLISAYSAPMFLVSAGVLVVLGLVALLFVRSRPLYLLAYLFFFVSISVVSNLVIPIGTVMAERFLYFPSVAFCWALTQLFLDLRWLAALETARQMGKVHSAKWLALVMVCLVLPWAVKSYLRNAEWRDDQTLFRAAVRVVPQSAKVHAILGDAHFREQDFLGAEREYLCALAIYPDYVGTTINLACTYDALGRPGEASRLLETVAPRSQGQFEIARLRELARAYIGLKDYPSAAAIYEKVLRLTDIDALVHRNLGGIYLQFLNEPEKGRAHIRRSLELSPNQPGADQLRALLDSPSVR